MGRWFFCADDGVTAATGGLYGLAYHINVAAAAAFGFEPTAIDDWHERSEHSNPGDYTPSLVSGTPIATVPHSAH
jgi:hypothetical protein